MIDNTTTQNEATWTYNAATYYRFHVDDCTKWTEPELRFQRSGTRSIWQWDNWPAPQSIWRRG